MVNRILNKIGGIINNGIGYLQLFLENKGVVSKIAYSFFKEYKNAIQVNHPYPLNIKEADKPLFSHYTNYETGHEQVFIVEKVYVNNLGVVSKGLKNFGSALPHPIFRNKYGLFYLIKARFFKNKRVLNSHKYYLLIHDFWSAGNYYHWLIDSLPRLLNLKEEIEKLDISILLPENAPKFITTSINYFELKHITKISKNELVYIDKLLVSNYTVGSGHIHPKKVLEIRRKLLDNVVGTGKFERIYVSRGKQKARRIVNEAEVIEILKQHNFQILYFENLSFEEQVLLVKNAKYYVGSHGANMTNLMFMKDGAGVLELIREDSPNFCYWALSDVCKMNYYYQLCSIAEKDHLFVNLSELKANLKLLLNE